MRRWQSRLRRKDRRPWRIPRLLASVVAGLATLVAGSDVVPAATSSTCRDVAALVEQREGLPAGLLHAIALTESGRWDPSRKISYAWPWTVRAKADAFVGATAEQALRVVRRLQAEGRENIDVGCMQVNLMYHGHEFDSLEAAIDPLTNISYAAAFLKRLHRQTRSWPAAVQRYHSSDPDRGRAYRGRVDRNWRLARDQARRQQRPEATRADAAPAT
ncbi:MAG: transglycosylase SLT domain-containing protein, partial [Geminicoccaceae bacterium]|nr:transglycosylase SLT domain-containing protein [Geminicoccaceae bacterium]